LKQKRSDEGWQRCGSEKPKCRGWCFKREGTRYKKGAGKVEVGVGKVVKGGSKVQRVVVKRGLQVVPGACP